MDAVYWPLWPNTTTKLHHRVTEDTEMELNQITDQIISAAIEVHKAL